ncbi:MAG: helix-turn-helix domain-containing protein [Gemmatimonadaceae bacterium]|nr:helix-turn-helix domain-containing protein [Gemmatimonadaceae bacterium]
MALIDAMFGETPGWDQAVRAANERLNAAQAIHALRIRHKLTQSELAELVNTKQSVIARLEDAAYAGHSMRMLQRIAGAVGEQVIVSFAPVIAARPKRQRAVVDVKITGTGAKKAGRTVGDRKFSSSAKRSAKKRSSQAA